MTTQSGSAAGRKPFCSCGRRLRSGPPRHRNRLLRAVRTLLPQPAVDQFVREGDSEEDYVVLQASKDEDAQAAVSEYLQQTSTTAVDVCVVGCGPAGLALSAALASRGIEVCLVGPESKFTNNYGVWVDEFSALGLSHVLDHVWQESLCYFSDREVRLSRAYGRVDRAALRDHLLTQCKEHGVKYVPEVVTAIDCEQDDRRATAHTASGRSIEARLVTLAGGAASAKFLHFEDDAPAVAAQTAYGVTAKVHGYADAFDPDAMLFMDYRRTHAGLWDGTANRLSSANRADGIKHPNWSGNFGTCAEAPSFLYAMPLSNGDVFLEETCLVARPTLPFSELKRRLHRRCAAMGLTISQVIDEEHSYIPVGGPMPMRNQPLTAFGAAANLVHPATGYSITRMLEETQPLADAMAGVLSRDLPIYEGAAQVWDALWPMEKRRQASFHIFGMELLATLDVKMMHEFFETFFALPDFFWRGFLASKLSSAQLAQFALLMFVKCSMGVRVRLMQHLVLNPAGGYLIRTYLRRGE